MERVLTSSAKHYWELAAMNGIIQLPVDIDMKKAKYYFELAAMNGIGKE